MTGFDLNKAMTDIDERFIEEADVNGKKTPVMSAPVVTKKSRRRVFRVVLISACLVALLVGTVVAGNKVLKRNRFLETIDPENGPEELGDAWIPMNITKTGNVTVTLENIIADVDCLFCQFSTDVSLGDHADGWILDKDDHDVELQFSGKAVFEDEEWYGGTAGTSPFCKDGKLWYLYTFAYTATGMNLGNLPIQVEVKAVDHREKTSETFLFEWTNNYDIQVKQVPVSVNCDPFILKEIDLSPTRIVLHAGSETVSAETLQKLTVDYVKLEDGSVWEYYPEGGSIVKDTGGVRYDGDTDFLDFYWIFWLTGEFAEKETGTNRAIPYDKIVAVSVNGTEISVR